MPRRSIGTLLALVMNTMQTENPGPAFQSTKNDISKIKNTASEAAQDLGERAVTHAEKAKSELSNLAKDAQEEGKKELEHAKAKFTDIVSCAKNYVSERPLAVAGAALVIGFLMGNCRSRSNNA